VKRTRSNQGRDQGVGGREPWGGGKDEKRWGRTGRKGVEGMLEGERGRGGKRQRGGTRKREVGYGWEGVRGMSKECDREM